MRRGPAVVFLLLLLAGVAFGAQRAALFAWSSVASFRPPDREASRMSTGSPPLANRLAVIIVDGLRQEDALLMPSLDWLTRQGARFDLRVPEPAYPAPSLATLLSGAPPVRHGVLLPHPDYPLAADHLFAAAHRAGLWSGAAGDSVLAALTGSIADRWLPTNPGQAAENGRALLAQGGPRLVVIRLEGLHLGIHRLDTADRERPEYRQLLAEADAQLVRLVELVDWKTTAVMVTGVSPTTTEGRHDPDGTTPLVLAGAGVKQGVRGTGSLLDVAPTAAALLGMPVPAGSQGWPLVNALNVSGRPADVVAERTLVARKSLADAVLRSLGVAETVADPPATAAEAAEYLDKVAAQVEEARFAWWKQDLVARLPYFGGAIILMLLYLMVVFRQPFAGAVLGGSLVYVLTFHGLFYLLGGSYSTALRGLEEIALRAGNTIGLQALTAGLTSAAVTGVMLARKGFKHGSYTAAAALHQALATAVLLALPTAVAVLLVGWHFPVSLPSPGLLVWFFLTAIQVVVIGYSGLLWAAVAANAARLVRRYWPPTAPAPGPADRSEPEPDRVIPFDSHRRRPRP